MDFTHHIDDAVLPNVTAARDEYNATATVGSAPGAGNPAPVATNDAFLRLKLDDLVSGWVKKYGLLPPPPPEVPAWYVVPRPQGLKALARADQVGLLAPIYEADIVAKITAMPETTPAEKLAKVDLMTEFQYRQTWTRGNPFFESLRSAMGITPAQSDALLQLADSLPE